MNVEDAVVCVLERLSDAQVTALATAIGVAAVPPDELGHVVAGASPSAVDAVASLRVAWQAAPALTGAGLSLALRVGLAARHDSYDRRARPVWTGPGALGEQRLTSGVLHELFAGAVERILLVSFAAYTIPDVATDLEAAVGRGCRVDVAFETTEDSAGAYTGPQRPFAHVQGIKRWRWPIGQRDAGAVLHAKLLVVDGRRALVSSANLTSRALLHNLEVGIVCNDHDVARSLEEHVRHLMSTGILQEDA